MWEEILSLAMSNGIWAVLFCLLLTYQLKDSKKRENKYQETIDKLTVALGGVEQIFKKVDAMNNKLDICLAHKSGVQNTIQKAS